MKFIQKGRPPKSLVEFAKKKFATYNGIGFPGEEWSTKLLQEQGYLCAFTMKRIKKTGLGNMKRAHIIPQNGTKEVDLNHNNVVACCMGNEGKPPKATYADTRQKNKPLLYISPLSHNCEILIKYRKNGEITCDNEELRNELVDEPSRDYFGSLLNLNHRDLVEGRVGVFNAVVRMLNKTGKKVKWKNTPDWRIEDIEQWIKAYSTRDRESKFYEYCNYVIFRLKKEHKWRIRKQ